MIDAIPVAERLSEYLAPLLRSARAGRYVLLVEHRCPGLPEGVEPDPEPGCGPPGGCAACVQVFTFRSLDRLEAAVGSCVRRGKKFLTHVLADTDLV